MDFFAEPSDEILIQVGGFLDSTGNLNFSSVEEGDDALVGGGEDAIIESDSLGSPVATHFIGDFPAPGQAITGLGIEVLPGPEGATVIFGITQNTRTVVFAELRELFGGARGCRCG